MKNVRSFFIFFLKGFCMGIVEIIPGISGGTIAIVLGVYERLIKSIQSVDCDVIKDVFQLKWRTAFKKIDGLFLLCLFGGSVFAILLLSKPISWLFLNKPNFLMAFFFGLIMSTIPIISNLVKEWKWQTVITVLVFSVLTFYLVKMVPSMEDTVTSKGSFMLMIFLSGFLAVSAMILPGLSGSFVLLLFGQYRNILEALNQRDFFVISIFLGGCVLGLFSMVRFLSWLFKNYYDWTIAMILGIIIGSMSKIWPWKETVSTMIDRHGDIIPVQQINIFPQNLNQDVIFSIGLMVLGFFIVFLLNRRSQT